MSTKKGVKIAIVNTKGGVGKTTTAMYLAIAATVIGKTVELRDADDQGSATEWYVRAAEHEPLPFPVVVANSKTLGMSSEADLVFIDTPPGTAASIDASLRCADFIIIPTGPTPADIDRTWHTISLCRNAKVAFGVLIANITPGTKLLDVIHEALDEEQVPVFETEIRRREEVRRDFGTCPSNLHGYDKVLDELLEEINA